MAALRCTSCLTNWPNNPTYAKCPECGDKCDPMANAKPIELAEAKSRARFAAFDREYEKREETREGPTPEEIGRQEAHAIVAEWRELDTWFSG